MSTSEYFKEKICIVTGANSGIGYAMSSELLKRGATVYMAGRNKVKVTEAVESLAAYKGRTHPIIVDVTDQAQVQKAIEDTKAEAGRIDLLFNNAGIGKGSLFETATLADWKKIIDTNLCSVIYGVHAAVPIMLEQGSGHIVNTGSFNGIFPSSFQALYCTTKFGVTGLTECLRYEYADKGLFFSTVCPANVATPIFKKDFDGNVHEEAPIPSDAYPVDKAAEYILDKVAERRGIIVVPEEPFTQMCQGYWIGDKQLEQNLAQVARDRRAAYEKNDHI